MAKLSLDHIFVVKDKENIDRLIDALTKPVKKATKPTVSISGQEAITLLMNKWRNARLQLI